MKAVVYTKYGPPDVLQHTEVPKPEPLEDEVLVKVRATSVNRTDCANMRAKPWIMRLTMGLFKPKNPILGTEFSGEIEAAGQLITSYKEGDKVFGFSDGGLRSYADYLVLSEKTAFTIMPDKFSYEQAAGCIEGFHYAYNIINKVPLKSGDAVLVNGASGGIGTATVQLLKYFGAEVTAVCNTKNIALVKSLGAGKVIDYEKEDFTKIKAHYNFVFDTVGKSTFGKSRAILKPGGAYISSELGPWSQNLYFSLITAIFGSLPGQSGKKVKFPYPPNIMRSITLLKKLIEEGKYKSVIDRKYPLEQIADAFRYVETGQKTGNVVITISE
jgi:NADPH:quinone reductase-like Zn-dependent oxidoreductase